MFAVSEIWAFTDKSVGREEVYRSRGASCGWKPRALLVTATVGSTLMALPTAPPEKGSRSPSTLMRWLNEAAETIQSFILLNNPPHHDRSGSDNSPQMIGEEEQPCSRASTARKGANISALSPSISVPIDHQPSSCLCSKSFFGGNEREIGGRAEKTKC